MKIYNKVKPWWGATRYKRRFAFLPKQVTSKDYKIWLEFYISEEVFGNFGRWIENKVINED